MNSPDNNAVIIARVSTKGQEGEGYSLESQLKTLQAYCENVHLITRRSYKIAESASKSEQRKTFKEAMAYIADHNIKNLVVEKVDRHVRNLHDAVETHDWLLHDEERRVHFVKDSLVMHKNSRSQEWLNWGIRVVMAKNYIDNLREEAMKGWAEKLAQGWMPGPPPPGYRTVIKDGRRVHDFDPNTAKSMQKVFSLALNPGYTIERLADKMTEFGILTKHGRPFAPSHVHRILKNPFYIGVIQWDGKQYPGKQPKLVPEKLFNTVQDKITRKLKSKMRKHNPVFRGIIVCEHCGKNVTWQKQKGRMYGACQRRLPACRAQKFIREDEVFASVESKLDDLICPSQQIISWLTNLLRSDFQLTVNNQEEAEKALYERIQRVKRMDDMLYDDKLAGLVSVERYLEKHEAFASEIKGLEKQKGGLSQEYEEKYMNGISVIELSQDAKRQFKDQNIDNDEKRQILTKLFEKISVKDNSISVTYTKLTGAIARKSVQTREILAYA